MVYKFFQRVEAPLSYLIAQNKADSSLGGYAQPSKQYISLL